MVGEAGRGGSARRGLSDSGLRPTAVWAESLSSRGQSHEATSESWPRERLAAKNAAGPPHRRHPPPPCAGSCEEGDAASKKN